MPIKLESDDSVSLEYISLGLTKTDIQTLVQDQKYAHVKRLQITNITQDQADELLPFVKEQTFLSVDVSLPTSIQNTRTQIHFDRIISDHRSKRNSERIRSMSRIQSPISKPVEARILPEIIKPKIEILLSEEVLDEGDLFSDSAIADEELKDASQLLEIKRSPLAATVVEQIIRDRKTIQHEWSELSNRDEAKAFSDAKTLREKLQAADITDHPLHILLQGSPELKEQLTRFTRDLKLNNEQYDALLDVCGQYGTLGITRLFDIWNGYTAEEMTIFKELYDSIIKYMPTYLPFLEDKDFKETISSIMKLTDTKRSWWMALVKNHGLHSGYSNLKELYECFISAVSKIESMGLSFKKISGLTIPSRDLFSTLSNLLRHLNKCHKEDLAEQWECISKVDFFNVESRFHFLVPEMDEKIHHLELGDIQELINRNDLEGTKTAFYRYIAARKQHLPLQVYKTIVQKICSEEAFNDGTNKLKIKMIYVLAQATSVDTDEIFNATNVSNEWNDFLDRYINLEYLSRIKANYGTAKRLAYETGLTYAVGGPMGVRNKAIDPFIEMKYLPPMSFLNKLNNLSEYKFLDPNLGFVAMKSIQNKMIATLKEASYLYQQYPNQMQYAVRLIKTETTKINAAGKYIPEQKDRNLLETFVTACKTLLAPEHNDVKDISVNNQPRDVLLPLLTVFHLEYENKETLEGIITRYKQRMRAERYPERKEFVQKLLPYGLSLLRHVITREGLEAKALDHIQDVLYEKIGTGEFITRLDIRQWMEQNYGIYFERGEVPKDIINIEQYFDEFKCNSETRKNIQSLINFFNLEEEQVAHRELIESLVKLEKSLTASQKKRFFKYCQKELKKSGLLSREKQATTPPYLQQFKSLIDSIASSRSFDRFEQYMNITQKQVLESKNDSKKFTEKNAIEKCLFFLNILYPALIKNEEFKLTPKDAFSFATLVCRTPLETLHSSLARFSDDKEPVITKNSGEVVQLYKVYQSVSTFKDKKSPSQRDYTTLLSEIKILTSLDQKHKETYLEIEKILKEIIQENDNLIAWIGSFVPNFLKPRYEKLQILQAKLFGMPMLKLLSFTNVVLELHQKRQRLRDKYPNISACADDFISRALMVSPDHTGITHKNISLLVNHLIDLDDQNLAFSLIYQFNGQVGRRSIQDLIQIFLNESFKKIRLKTTVLNVIMTQINNGINCELTTIQHFLDFICNHQDDLLVIQYLNKLYKHAPFPTLTTFMWWARPPIDEKELNSEYAVFDRNPCSYVLPDGRLHNGREADNGFKQSEARENLKNWPEVKDIFTDDYLNNIQNTANFAKHLSTEAILNKLKEFKDKKLDNHIQLVMFTAEFLHRTKGRTPEFINGKQKLGLSFELNTTQIMAILAMFEKGQRVTAGIGTSEGKTRIMMVINACQYLKGNTVDCVTDNLALAERDFLSSLTFFKSLGAEVNFIRKNSDIKDYKIGGIHFSDKSNLKAFRRKAAKKDRLAEVLDRPEKCCLSLDEADTVFLDGSDIAQNDSTTIPEIYKKILPIYPLLMRFFAEEGNEELYKTDKQKCTETLLEFIKTVNPTLYNIIQGLPDKIFKMEKWQDVAYMARHIKFGDRNGFTIVTNATVETPFGPKHVAKALCYDGARVVDGGIFEHGLHQCLHAELNRLISALESGASIEDKHLEEMLNLCRLKGLRFEVTPERPTGVPSDGADGILKYYKVGSLYAVTGTIGSKIVERPEIQAFVNTEFIDVPRHKGVNRLDRPFLMTNNDDEQLEALIAHVIESYRKHQPILLVCKDDNESKRLHDELKRRIPERIKMDRIHAVTDFEDEKSEADVIKISGEENHLLVTTEMEGRGTDIEIEEKVKNVGLKVLLTYLPKSKRQLDQILSRTGRYGAVGETQMILNLQQLKQDFGIKNLSDDYYVNPEAFISQLQLFSEHEAQLLRLFNKAFKNFFDAAENCYRALGITSEKGLHAWQEFLDHYQTCEKTAKDTILSVMKQPCPDIEQIEKELKSYVSKVSENWASFLSKSDQALTYKLPEAIAMPELLIEWINKAKALRGHQTVTVDMVQKVKVHERFDPALAGRMHVLKNPKARPWFATTSAIWHKFSFSKWWSGQGSGGILGTGLHFFANWYAYRKNEISFDTYLSQTFPTFFKSRPITEERIVKKKVPLIHATLTTRTDIPRNVH